MRHVFQSSCYYLLSENNKNTMEGYNQAYQLIDEHKHYNKQALESVISSLEDCNKDYFTVAIIGAQNTGKSTLLNNLFKTNFSVLKGQAGNRTTRGVVLGRDFSEKLIIMDVQGNDSYETHVEGDQNYEKMVGSFALIGANVLLVNIFEKQLGQHSGSQYETLSTVMRICIDQFKQESPKTILFTLRDFNPNVTDEAECRSKVRADVLNIWKSVFTGTKRSADFEKYLTAPERFFTLEVAFLREYDVDYPEDFQEDVQKLRKRFTDPSDEGYLFKKQKKEYNLPIHDMVSLLDKVWNNLTSDKELNLPNEKVQVANYRCQEICSELSNAFEKDLEEKKTEARNYTVLLGELKNSFEHKTQHYNKQITEKWQAVLQERVKPKIGKVIIEFIENTEKELEEKYKFQIDNLFFDLLHTTDNFKVQAERVKIAITEQLITCYKNINYEIPDRKARIDKFTAILLDLIEEDIKKRLEEDKRDFENEIAREMGILIATVLKNSFNLSFYSEITRLYSIKKSELLQNFNRKLIWARGIGGNANELDDAEIKMIETLKQAAKKAMEQNMLEKLFEFFKENFYFDQHQTRYDYNILSDEKAVEIFTEAKEMVLNLIKYLNNFKLQPERRSSMIMTEDFEDQDEMKPLLESNSILTIQEQFQRKASDEYATVVRKRNQAHMKQVPTYLFVVIFYFLYDDVWFKYEEYPIIHCLLLGLVTCIGLIYAVGQGHIMRQMVQVFYESVLSLLGRVKGKVDQSRQGSRKQANQEKKDA